MVRCDRLSIPEAYIIDEIEPKDGDAYEHNGLVLPPEPAYDYYDWQEPQDQIHDYQNLVIIIEL